MARAGLQPARRPSVSVIVAMLLALHVHAVVTWTKKDPDVDNKGDQGEHADPAEKQEPEAKVKEGTAAEPAQVVTRAGENMAVGITESLPIFGTKGDQADVLKADRTLVGELKDAKEGEGKIQAAGAEAEKKLEEAEKGEKKAEEELTKDAAEAERLTTEAKLARKEADKAKAEAEKSEKEATTAKADAEALQKKVDTDKGTADGKNEKSEESKSKVTDEQNLVNFDNANKAFKDANATGSANEELREDTDKKVNAEDNAETLRAAADVANEKAKLLEEEATEAEAAAKTAQGVADSDKEIVDAKKKQLTELEKQEERLIQFQKTPEKFTAPEQLKKYKDEKTGGLWMFTRDGLNLDEDVWRAQAQVWATTNKEFWPTSAKPRCCEWDGVDGVVRSDFNVCPVDGRDGKSLMASYRCQDKEEPVADKPDEKKKSGWGWPELPALNLNPLNWTMPGTEEAKEAATEDVGGKKVSPLVLYDLEAKKVLINMEMCKKLNMPGEVDGRGELVTTATAVITHLRKTVIILCNNFPAVSKTLTLLGCCKESESGNTDTATDASDETRGKNDAKGDKKSDETVEDKDTKQQTRRVRLAMKAAGRVALHRFQRRVRKFLRGMMH